MNVTSLHQHGSEDPPSRSTYTRGCRCDRCTEANRAWQAEWRARRRSAGTHRLLHGRWISLTTPAQNGDRHVR